MPANHSGARLHYWAGRFPGLVGHLYSPGDSRHYGWLPFALDNGAYSAWQNGTSWNAATFRKHVERYAQRSPRWLVVPDVVANADATLASWERWEPELRRFGVPLAFAVQDGMTEADVPHDADVVFVGGSTRWKRQTLAEWCQRFPRVHIGRINTERWLWRCVEVGAESCDGSGWFRGDSTQLAGLERFLERYAAGARHPVGANYVLSFEPT